MSDLTVQCHRTCTYGLTVIWPFGSNSNFQNTFFLVATIFYSDVPVLSFSDRIYNTSAGLRYGTVQNHILHRRKNTVQTVLVRSTVFCLFCREKGGPGFNSRSELCLTLFHPSSIPARGGFFHLCPNQETLN